MESDTREEEGEEVEMVGQGYQEVSRGDVARG